MDIQKIVHSLKHNNHVLTMQLTILAIMEIGLLTLVPRNTSCRILKIYPFTYDYDGSEDIMLGDGREHKFTNTGSASLPSSNRTLTLSNILDVYKIKKNLTFVYQFCNENFISISFSPYLFFVKDFCMGTSLLVKKFEN